MDVRQILEQVDAYYEQNQGKEAEKLMRRAIEQAVGEEDDGSLLQLLNELLGYYRETGDKEAVGRLAPQTIAQAKRMGLEGTVPYATTLLNVANAYRACGRLEDSLECYRGVEEIYQKELKPDSMFVAGLKNNLSLLYQEMGDFVKAKENLLQALSIAEQKGEPYEIGVTCANLAGTCAQLGELAEAGEYAKKSARVFEEHNVTDSHYGAALSTLGTCLYREARYGEALDYYRRAAEIVEKSLGKNESYRRLQEYIAACEEKIEKGEGPAEDISLEKETGMEKELDMKKKGEALKHGGQGRGLRLARAYYEAYGRPMIEEKFPDYAGRIAVGLVGRGSDCFGFDDDVSMDHDWGPDFCMWVSDETYREIGEALQEAYDGLPEDFQGCRRAPRVNGKRRRGVIRISEFYRGLTGAERYEEIDWRNAEDFALAAAVNGEVFRDDEGIFSAFREKLQKGYPEEIQYLKIADAAAKFSQSLQYNFPRMRDRGDELTAGLMMWEGVREAMRLQHYIERKYPPHDKWLRRSLCQSEDGRQVEIMLRNITTEQDWEARRTVELLGAFFSMNMYYGDGFISDTDNYLDAHSEELVQKSAHAAKSDEELVEEIARLEFEAFDKVHNEGGRASCQNDWATFSIMRKSQYLTWTRPMLIQYLYDFYREYRLGHNLIEEKYGRMMESTAPEEYEKIKSHFPVLTEEKKQIIENICGLQVGWMEEFAKEYPALADNARSIHTSEDNPFNTSYETYLRGELGTYSDKMLELYGRYIVSCAKSGRNLARDIMENSVRMYGYDSIEEAEEKTAAAWKCERNEDFLSLQSTQTKKI